MLCKSLSCSLIILSRAFINKSSNENNVIKTLNPKEISESSSGNNIDLIIANSSIEKKNTALNAFSLQKKHL